MTRPSLGSRARERLRADLIRAYDAHHAATRVARLRLWLQAPELRLLMCVRLGELGRDMVSDHAPGGRLVSAAASLLRRHYGRSRHVWVDPRADIGPGLRIMHGYSILIGPTVMGEQCVVHHTVTIGERVAKGDHAVPRIGDRVWIGPGAILTGGVTVGDGATIAAGSVLSRNVPAAALVAGNPARVVQHDYDNSALMGLADEHDSVDDAEP